MSENKTSPVNEVSIEELEKNAGKLSNEEKRQRIIIVVLLVVGYIVIRLYQGGF